MYVLEFFLLLFHEQFLFFLWSWWCWFFFFFWNFGLLLMLLIWSAILPLIFLNTFEHNLTQFTFLSYTYSGKVYSMFFFLHIFDDVLIIHDFVHLKVLLKKRWWVENNICVSVKLVYFVLYLLWSQIYKYYYACVLL